MAVIHRAPGEEPTRLATDLTFADGQIRQGIGLMLAQPLEPGEAMVFRFDDARNRHVHTWFVRAPIDVVWIEREQVVERMTLPPWSFGRRARADTIVELPADVAADVSAGDIVRID